MVASELPGIETEHGIFRSGVVTIIGPPNAGKSTLLNHFLGQKIAIVTPRPQTTRNRILGILTGSGYQIILLDTPGLHKPRELLNRRMVDIALDALAEADVVLCLADGAAAAAGRKGADRVIAEYLKKAARPAVLAINKVDRLDKARLLPLMAHYAGMYDFAATVPISALLGDGTDQLLQEIIRRLPPGPQYYPQDSLTDATQRFIAAEIIREKIFLLTREEVPYAAAVLIDSFREAPPDRPVVIDATIMVEKASQKGIIIGRKGAMLAEIRRQAAPEIAAMLDQPVELHLFVKVRKNWTGDEQILAELGLPRKR